MSCPACGEATVDGASFCEACGADLQPQGPPCVDCGAAGSEILDGYCMQCGHKQPGPRDHLQVDLGWLAGVTDKGRRHHHNEDAMALDTVGATALMVVCDGVSTTDGSHEASQIAADAALDVMRAGVREGSEPADVLQAAADAAQRAVIETGDAGATASSTLVAAIAQPVADQVHCTVGWLGDSRAYWIGGDPALLTTDHSWANEMIAAGALAEPEAHAHPHAATITRWIGGDAPQDGVEVTAVELSGPGRLLLCSDGLWNYAGEPDDLAARPEWQLGSPMEQAVALTAFANEAGGHDNITAAIASFTDPAAPQEGEGDGPVQR